MDDIHLSREILRAVENGKLSKGVLDELTAEHLLNRCPHCRSEFEAFEAERRAGGAVSRAFQALSALLTSWISRGSREMRTAQRELAELLGLSPDERTRRVESARSRFRSPALVRLLLEESRRRIPGRPAEAFELAELAWRILNRNPRMPAFYDLYVPTIMEN